jgi:hypothetical protein
MMPTESLLAKLPDAKLSGKNWIARCPAHEDRQASLSIGEGEDGRALIYCHAGCKPDAICEAVGLRLADLMPASSKLPNPGKPTTKSRIVAEYSYRDEGGNLIFQALRYEPKSFRQRKPKLGGEWEWSVKGVRVVPYRLPELLADETQAVVIAEGEKDCENLAKIGLVATCNAGGAGKWTAEHAAFLRGRRVVILPDNDDPGRNHAHQVAESLQGIAESVRIVELPGLPVKGDVSDWLLAGGTRGALENLATSAREWTPMADQPWPDVIPFDLLELPEFPTHALPGALRVWVEAESHATQTPADLAALLALAVCSAGIARRVVIEARPDWREPVNLFTAVLLEPGNRKSAVFGDALRPLRELESELIESARSTVARAKSERRQDEIKLQKLEKQAADDPHARHEAGSLAEELAARPEPALPRLLVDDATAEKIGAILAEQGGRIASMSPEGSVFDLMAGQYSKSGTPQFGVYLMGHSGDDLVTDRQSRPSIRVERPALTCAYAMQPVVIKGLAGNAAFRGRGLLGRFLYAAPQSWIGRREIAPVPVTPGIREEYHKVVRRLAEGNDEAVLLLNDDAAGRLREWEKEIEEMLGDGGDLEMLKDWGAKLAGATLRIVAVLHCVGDGPNGNIRKPSIDAAIEIARYLIPHAEAVLGMMLASDDSTEDDAQYVLKWIERHGRQEFTKSEAQHHGKRRFPRADDIDSALGEITRRGIIRSRPLGVVGPGRPPSPAFDVNPAIFDSRNREPRSCNSHIAIDYGSSGNIRSASQQSRIASRVQVTI